MQEIEAVEHFYNTLSKDYDRVTTETPETWTPNRFLLEMLRKSESTAETLLDLGAGTGQTIQNVTEVYPDIEVTAIDASGQMLSEIPLKGIRAQLIRGDMVKEIVKLPDNSYSLVVAIGCLEFVEDLKPLFQNIYRTLQPDGNLYFTYELFLKDADTVQSTRENSIGLANTEKRMHTFRRDSKEIDKLLASSSLELTERQRLISYYRADEPVVYEIVHAKKIS